MCRNFTVFFIAIIMITLTACSKSSTAAPSSLEEIPSAAGDTNILIMNGDLLYDPQTLGETENLADYIVKGTLLNDAKQKLERYGPDVNFGVTVSSFEISHVYKGNLKEGDKIPIAERYYTVEENGKLTRHELAYAPSAPGEEYIFFLIKEEDRNEFLRGFYTPVAKEKGRYLFAGSEGKDGASIDLMSANELNIVGTDVGTYKSLYKQVKTKYIQ